MAPVALSHSNFSDNPETSEGLPPQPSPPPHLSSPSSVIIHLVRKESLKGDYNPSGREGRENTSSAEQ